MRGSGRHGEHLAIHLFANRLLFIEALAISQRGVANARELVGQRAGGLVVIAALLHRQRPGPQRCASAPRVLGYGGGAQDAARAMREQHAQVAVTLLGDAPQIARAARAVFLGRQAEPAGEVARILEVAHVARGGCHHGGGGEPPHAGDRQQRGARRAQARDLGQLALQLRDARFEQAHLFEQQAHGAADQAGHGRMRIGQHAADRLQAGARAGGHRQAELAAEASQGIDARGACSHPQASDAMQSLQGLLLDGLHAHRAHIRGAGRLQQGGGVSSICLVAFHIGAHVLRRQQAHFDAQRIQPARPVVR